MSTNSGGGFRAQNLQDLFGAVFSAQDSNSTSISSTAQTAVLNKLLGYAETITISDSSSIVLGSSVWSASTFNLGYWQ